MSSKSRQKQPPFKAIAANDDLKYKRKYKELKKKIREMEEENEKLSLKLTRAKKNIQRLRIERSFLFDRLEQSQPTNESESDTTSSPQRAIDSEEDLSSSAEELLGQRAGKRKKQNRDPNAPKRPRNAFLLYCKIQREQGFQDVTRILSQKWKDLPNEEKQEYYDMYNKDRQRYEEERSSYISASLKNSGYPQQGGDTQNEVTTYLEEGNNMSIHHDYDDDESYRNDTNDEVRPSLITAGTSQGATTALESPYNDNHPYEKHINENERGIESEFEEKVLVETKENIKLGIGNEYESDSDSDMVDELEADEPMEYEDESEEAKLKDENEGEGNITGGGSISENNEF